MILTLDTVLLLTRLDVHHEQKTLALKAHVSIKDN